jgi:prophage regulatory protein
MTNSGLNTVLEQIKDNLPATGFVRLTSILAPQGPIPVGRSTWWAGVKTGRFPKPVKLGPRTTAWKVEDIRDLIEKAS